jgi:hypothetical protein
MVDASSRAARPRATNSRTSSVQSNWASQVAVLVHHGERRHEAVDADDFTVDDAVAEVLDLEHGAQHGAQHHVERRQVLRLAPRPEVRHVERETQIDRGAVHAVEEVEAVAPPFEVMHAPSPHRDSARSTPR